MTRTAADLMRAPDRIVKPRIREYRHYPIVAILGDQTLDEHGELGTVDDFIGRLPKSQPLLIAAINSADLLARMDSIYKEWTPNSWQFRISDNERDICDPNGVRVATKVTVSINYLGWKNGNYHKVIDPVVMSGHRLDKLWPGGPVSPLYKLLEWAMALRDFCDANSVDIRPTHGGISSQFLTDPRFYPHARRKVPAVINEAVREHMPGNHYRLDAETHETEQEYTALYLDQSRAHHYHARITHLPDANSLYAHGDWKNLEHHYADNVASNFYGLYCLDLAPPLAGYYSDFTWLRNDALTKIFVWTNELTDLLDMGYRVTGVYAAWGSNHRDTGLAKYAAWAETQLDSYENPPWLKPLLLSAYGTLATRPRYSEAVFRLAKAGTPRTVRTGRSSVQGIATRGSKRLEPAICNVLHRGMIEAACRAESVGLAQHLKNLGLNVLSIYADAVIVEQDVDKPLPILPEPWRLKDTLTRLQFINKQAFVSGQMTKLPGVGGRDLLRHALRAHPPARINVEYEMEQDESQEQHSQSHAL